MKSSSQTLRIEIRWIMDHFYNWLHQIRVWLMDDDKIKVLISTWKFVKVTNISLSTVDQRSSNLSKNPCWNFCEQNKTLFVQFAVLFFNIRCWQSLKQTKSFFFLIGRNYLNVAWQQGKKKCFYSVSCRFFVNRKSTRKFHYFRNPTKKLFFCPTSVSFFF